MWLLAIGWLGEQSLIGYRSLYGKEASFLGIFVGKLGWLRYGHVHDLHEALRLLSKGATHKQLKKYSATTAGK